MEENTVGIRLAAPEDAEALLAIYAPYVEETAITFEYDVPSCEEFRRRMETVQEKYPYLVAEDEGQLLGYAYTSAFVGRAAYDWSAEVSIYLRRDCRKQGLGRRMYQVLEAVSRAQGIRNLYACIACPRKADRYLDRNSVEFHAHLGYQQVGHFQSCGYKFGTWYDMVWMEKHLGNHTVPPAPVVPFPALEWAALRALGVE